MTVYVVVVAGTVATAAVVAWFAFTKKHPENAASHYDEHPDTPSNRSRAASDGPASAPGDVVCSAGGSLT